MILHIQFPASSQQSNFSDTFLEELPPFLHFHSNPDPRPFGKQLISDWFSLSGVAILLAEISSLTLQHSNLGSIAVLRHFLKQLLVAAGTTNYLKHPQTRAVLWGCTEN